MRGIRSGAVCCAVIALAAAGAQGVVVSYTSRAAWEGGGGSTSVLDDFSGNQLNQSIATYAMNGAGHTVGPFDGAGAFYDRLDSGGTTTWSFTSAVTAFGADFDFTPGGSGSGINVNITLTLGGNVVAGSILNPSSATAFVGFWGLTSTDAFDAITFSESTQPWGVAETYTMDNLTVTLIPLPAPALMAGMGLAGLGAFRIARRRHA